jgi:hypothetical protein
VSDPIVDLLPEAPDVFERLPAAERAWRGRLFLVLFGAGFEIIHAWWIVLSDAEDLVDVLKVMERVTDAMIPAMVAGRLRFDVELARQAAFGGQ